MGLITPLYDSLWNEYLAWSALVALFTFGWLYHHSFFYRSKDGENPNVDNLEVGVFPVENDDLKLELAWTIVPFILIVYLTYISWAPLDNIWASPDDGHFGSECDYSSGMSSNLSFDPDAELKGEYTADCYHTIEIQPNNGFGVLIVERSKQNYVSPDLLKQTEEPCLISPYRRGMHISHT